MKSFDKDDQASRNQQHALQQFTTVSDADGTERTVVLGAEPRRLHQDFQSQNADHVIPVSQCAAPINPPLPCRQSTGKAPEPVPIPPPEIRDARQNKRVMQAVQDNKHLQVPRKRCAVDRRSEALRPSGDFDVCAVVMKSQGSCMRVVLPHPVRHTVGFFLRIGILVGLTFQAIKAVACGQ